MKYCYQLLTSACLLFFGTSASAQLLDDAALPDRKPVPANVSCYIWDFHSGSRFEQSVQGRVDLVNGAARIQSEGTSLFVNAQIGYDTDPERLRVSSFAVHADNGTGPNPFHLSAGVSLPTSVSLYYDQTIDVGGQADHYRQQSETSGIYCAVRFLRD